MMKHKDWLVEEMERAMVHAHSLHGPLTTDYFRALTIMAEEVGEVSKELLSMARSHNKSWASKAVDHRRRAICELLQVISTAAFMIDNLVEGHEHLKSLVSNQKIGAANVQTDFNHSGSTMGQRGQGSDGAGAM